MLEPLNLYAFIPGVFRVAGETWGIALIDLRIFPYVLLTISVLYLLAVSLRAPLLAGLRAGLCTGAGLLAFGFVLRIASLAGLSVPSQIILSALTLGVLIFGLLLIVFVPRAYADTC